jgi:hypothetical protein
LFLKAASPHFRTAFSIFIDMWEISKLIMHLENYFKNGKVYIWKETFAIIKSKKVYPNAFANVIDKNETTVIIEQSKFNDEDIIEIEKDWKILTFDMVLPFGLVGFLAKVSKVLADEKILIFAISAYSTDHILVKEKDLARAEEKLKELGCIFKER